MDIDNRMMVRVTLTLAWYFKRQIQ